MDVLTIAQAAQTTGWSARMLRYIEQSGLVAPRRSEGGYRLYGPAQIERLRSLKELVAAHDLGLAELAFAARLRVEPALGDAVAAWFDTRGPSLSDSTGKPDRTDADWLRFEQEKHERLLTHTTSS